LETSYIYLFFVICSSLFLVSIIWLPTILFPWYCFNVY